ncbi:18242_t:CDS:1, partial [Gigaspora margarita]
MPPSQNKDAQLNDDEKIKIRENKFILMTLKEEWEKAEKNIALRKSLLIGHLSIAFLIIIIGVVLYFIEKYNATNQVLKILVSNITAAGGVLVLIKAFGERLASNKARITKIITVEDIPLPKTTDLQECDWKGLSIERHQSYLKFLKRINHLIKLEKRLGVWFAILMSLYVIILAIISILFSINSDNLSSPYNVQYLTISIFVIGVLWLINIILSHYEGLFQFLKNISWGYLDKTNNKLNIYCYKICFTILYISTILIFAPLAVYYKLMNRTYLINEHVYEAYFGEYRTENDDVAFFGTEIEAKLILSLVKRIDPDYGKSKEEFYKGLKKYLDENKIENEEEIDKKLAMILAGQFTRETESDEIDGEVELANKLLDRDSIKKFKKLKKSVNKPLEDKNHQDDDLKKLAKEIFKSLESNNNENLKEVVNQFLKGKNDEDLKELAKKLLKDANDEDLKELTKKFFNKYLKDLANKLLECKNDEDLTKSVKNLLKNENLEEIAKKLLEYENDKDLKELKELANKTKKEDLKELVEIFFLENLVLKSKNDEDLMKLAKKFLDNKNKDDLKKLAEKLLKDKDIKYLKELANKLLKGKSIEYLKELTNKILKNNEITEFLEDISEGKLDGKVKKELKELLIDKLSKNWNEPLTNQDTADANLKISLEYLLGNQKTWACLLDNRETLTYLLENRKTSLAYLLENQKISEYILKNCETQLDLLVNWKRLTNKLLRKLSEDKYFKDLFEIIKASNIKVFNNIMCFKALNHSVAITISDENAKPKKSEDENVKQYLKHATENDDEILRLTLKIMTEKNFKTYLTNGNVKFISFRRTFRYKHSDQIVKSEFLKKVILRQRSTLILKLEPIKLTDKHKNELRCLLCGIDYNRTNYYSDKD